jgi:hypothetical protein
MTDPNDIDADIRNAIAQVWIAADRVEALIAGQCPGPHKYVQHRDMNPPWCPACRYTEAGVKIPRRSTT